MFILMLNAFIIRQQIYFYINMYMFFKGLENKTQKKKIYLCFHKNSFFYKNVNFYLTQTLFTNLLPQRFIKKLVTLFTNVFLGGGNVLFMNHNNNYNYLPISNKILFSRSSKYLLKFIKFFNVGVIIHMDLKRKNFIFKKMFRYKLINISLNNVIVSNNLDIKINLPNSELTNYLVYLFSLNFYLKCR